MRIRSGDEQAKQRRDDREEYPQADARGRIAAASSSARPVGGLRLPRLRDISTHQDRQTMTPASSARDDGHAQ